MATDIALHFDLHQTDSGDLRVQSIGFRFSGEERLWQAGGHGSSADYKSLALAAALIKLRGRNQPDLAKVVVGRADDVAECALAAAAYHRVLSRRASRRGATATLFPFDEQHSLYDSSQGRHWERPWTALFVARLSSSHPEIIVRQDILPVQSISFSLGNQELDDRSLAQLLSDQLLNVPFPDPPSSVEFRQPAVDSFVLLRDFPFAYDSFPLKVIDIDDKLQDIVVRPLEHALRSVVEDLRIYDLKAIHEITRTVCDQACYTVTLDGGTYFPHFDFSVEVTRAALSWNAVASGPYLRVPRDGSPNLITRAVQLERHYRKHGAGRPVVLCDDGIGTGQSLARIIQVLRDINMQVQRIVVLLNPGKIEQIQHIEVQALILCLKRSAWLSDRDLVWGLPRSGLSVSKEDGNPAACGVPYTTDDEIAEARIGLPKDAASRLRSSCIEVNREFWKFLEERHHRPLFVSDCPRLQLPVGPLANPETRILEVIEEVADPSFNMLSAWREE